MSKEEALRLIKEAAETGATELDLSGQELTELPLELFQLKNLIRLDLSSNQFSTLPPEIVQFTNLKELCLDGNPSVSPPLEIIEHGLKAICEYFASLEEGKQTLAEVKIILVGEGASGKTSLTRCLKGEPFNRHEETTHGIRIEELTLAGASRSIRCNLWDFGGQEIMHATHQFFLSRRSLYVLVLDGRRDERPEYWLRYIESFGGGSPVLVVLNKWDVNPGFDLNRPFLQEKYPFIKGFWRTSCSTGQGIEPFKQALLEALNNMPMTQHRWPTSWFRAKAMLEQMNEPRISYEKFEAICREAGVRDEISQHVLAEFLHDLGIVIHFNDFELDDNHVLDPKWVTGAVYKIINSPLIAAAKGLLRLDDLKKILQWQAGDEYKYWPADQVYIISLMKKFELCYELNAKEVLIPQLLGVSEPSFDFDYANALRFILHYEDFLPPSVIPRFIVKRNTEINDNLCWRSGVVLVSPMVDAMAVVRADNEARRIHIAVTGKERKIFLALIWLTFRELHAGFEGLKVSERIPLPDNPAISVAYESLLKSQETGIEKVFPEGADKAYSVQELLAGVHFDDPSEGERMLALAKADRQTESEKMQEMLQRYERRVKNKDYFGIGINVNALFDELLRRYKK